MGTGVAAVQKAVNDLNLPPSIRVEYGGTYKEQQKSFHDLVVVLLLALVLIFLVLLFEFRSFSAPLAILSSAVLSTSGVFLALSDHAHRFQRFVLHGLDHGDRHRGQERNSVARRQPEIPGGGIRGGGGHDSGRTPPAASHRDDGYGGRGGHAAVSVASCSGAGSQMLQPLAIAVIGGILISMVLSLIITPAIQYYLTHNKEAAVSESTPVAVR